MFESSLARQFSLLFFDAVYPTVPETWKTLATETELVNLHRHL